MKYLALLPALIHVYIFVLESLWWGRAAANRTFGVAESAVETLRPWAYNQGWYNLFLAVAAGAGTLWAAFGGGIPALVLGGYGLASMVSAALVLVISSPAKARAAAIQGVPALVGLAALVWG